jgi:hypothetical protein
VTGSRLEFEAIGQAPAGSKIKIEPSKSTINPGQSRSLKITITSDATIGDQQFGQVVLRQKVRPHQPRQTLHLPVAFVHQQGSVELTQSCVPSSVRKNRTTSCDVTATNMSFDAQVVDLKSKTGKKLNIVAANGASLQDKDHARVDNVALAGATAGVPSVDPGESPAGYLPLSLFGVTPDPIGDEDMFNYNVPPFLFNGVTYSTIGVDSNGYAVVGGGTAEDNNCCNLPTGPSAAPPNNLLAPFWTDLDGTGAQGIRAAVLTDGVNSWLVLEWQVNVFGTTSNRHFQIWIGVDGVQDISFAYDPAALPAAPGGQDFLVGAENQFGQGDVSSFLPSEDLVVTSTDPTPGGSYTYELVVKGKKFGNGVLTSSMKANGVPGTTIVRTVVRVTH